MPSSLRVYVNIHSKRSQNTSLTSRFPGHREMQERVSCKQSQLRESTAKTWTNKERKPVARPLAFPCTGSRTLLTPERVSSFRVNTPRGRWSSFRSISPYDEADRLWRELSDNSPQFALSSTVWNQRRTWKLRQPPFQLQWHINFSIDCSHVHWYRTHLSRERHEFNSHWHCVESMNLQATTPFVPAVTH